MYGSYGPHFLAVFKVKLAGGLDLQRSDILLFTLLFFRRHQIQIHFLLFEDLFHTLRLIDTSQILHTILFSIMKEEIFGRLLFVNEK